MNFSMKKTLLCKVSFFNLAKLIHIKYFHAMKYIIHLLFFALISFAMPVQAQSDKAVNEVKALLHSQTEDWNKGDIETFMEGYWKSEKLQFIGSRGVTYGWQQTLENYKKGYPDKATMGQLSFDLIDVTRQSRNVVSVTGKFMLKREKMDDASGHFLLIVKKIKGKWLIIADHTS